MNTLYLVACAPQSEGGGIYKYALSDRGRLERLALLPCEKPMYTVRVGNMLHTVVRYENEAAGKEDGAYFSLPLDKNGDFGTPLALKPSLGNVPCHLAVIGEDTYLVNYISGNVVKNGEMSVEHRGRGVNPTRQTSPHTHFVAPLPDGHIGVCDLGIDTLKIYDRDLKPISEARVPDGYGIRHFVTKSEGGHHTVYAINELVPSVSRFRYEKGRVAYVDSVTIPCECKDATAAAIRLSGDGKTLYTSVRGENILSSFALDKDGTPTLLQTVGCGGDGPRDFALCGTHLVCANQHSGTVTVLSVKDGKFSTITDEITLPDPLCVVL